VLLPVNLNETLLQELSISLLKNTRQIVFESCFESSKILLSMVALESRFNILSKRSELLYLKLESSNLTIKITLKGGFRVGQISCNCCKHLLQSISRGIHFWQEQFSWKTFDSAQTAQQMLHLTSAFSWEVLK
jgi:hypothetical protein